MSIDISAITSAARYNGMTVETTSTILGTSGSASVPICSTSTGAASVSSNGVDFVALSAQAMLDEAESVTGLDSGDLSDLVGDLSPMALSGLDSTSDLAVLQAAFGSSSLDSLLTGVVSASTSG